jgi:hypothetical protein
MGDLVPLDRDTRPLSRPLAVWRNGQETSIRTIARAVEFLISDLKNLAATVDWQLAVNALRAAHDDYTEPHIELATHLLEQVYRHASSRQR